ncbi:hypothetical protein ACFFRR_003256 [Megaselia abdita]
MQSLVIIPLLFAAFVTADIGLDIHNGYGGSALRGAGLSHARVVGVSQVRGTPHVTQSLTHGHTVSHQTVGPSHVTRQQVGFTPGTTTIRRDYETDVVHNQHRVDHIRTDRLIPKVTTVQHNSIRPVDVTHARTHTEVSNHVQHIPHVSHSAHHQVHHSHDSIVHPQVHHAGSHGLGHY